MTSSKTLMKRPSTVKFNKANKNFSSREYVNRPFVIAYSKSHKNFQSTYNLKEEIMNKILGSLYKHFSK